MIGGLVIGLLSAIPYVRLGNVICCMWIVFGGALGSYLYIRKSTVPVNMGEGAMIGSIAGAIGGILGPIIGVLRGIGKVLLKLCMVQRNGPGQIDFAVLADEDRPGLCDLHLHQHIKPTRRQEIESRQHE